MRGPGVEEPLDRLQARCIRELRDAEVDGAPGGFTVTGQSADLRERISAVIEAEFERDRRDEWPAPPEWFEVRPLD